MAFIKESGRVKKISQKQQMPKKKNILFFCLGLIFVAFLAFLFLNNNFYPKVTPPPEQSQNQVSTEPTILKIPSIGVDATVIPLGLTKDGKMDTPTKSMDTGWYDLGPAPGELGSAVIAGHRGYKIGPAVFDNLYKINIGDEVRVVNQKGEEFVFRVREKQMYNAEDKIPEVWQSDTGSHLNIITCSGNRNIFTGSSEKRLVVFTDLVT